MAYLTKTSLQMINTAIQKLQANTSITNTSPGSVVRAMIEIITSELGDFYSILDFNTQQNLIGTASGYSLDLIGQLYAVPRKTLSQVAAIDASLGSFYFYLSSPVNVPITIPNGTHVYSDNTSYVGQNFSYVTVGDTVIPTGYVRAWATIQPIFSGNIYTAGVGTLTTIDPLVLQRIPQPLYCTNPKAISTNTSQESDASYRSRIIQACRMNAGGTLTALRLTALNISGVRDVTMRQVPYGLGTAEALIVTSDNMVPSPLLPAISAALNAINPPGIKLYLNQPEVVPVDITASLTLATDSPLASSATIIQATTNMIFRFLNTPLVGTTLVYNELIQTILDTSDFTTDVTITNFAINGVSVLKQNYTPSDTQQLIPGAVVVSVATT